MGRLFLGAQHVHMEEVTSTNTLAQQLLKERPPEGMLVTTDKQSVGRGQAGTKWNAAAGQNLLMSVILYPKLQATEAFALGQMAALAVWECIHHFLPEADLHIKWPNDILLDGQKLAGILIENQLQGRAVSATVIGIGINVNQGIFPPNSGKPTSLFLHTGKAWDRDEVREKMLDYLEKNYLRLRQHGGISFRRDFEARMYGYKQKVQLSFDGNVHECLILGTDGLGHLLVKTPQNTERSFALKEVRFVL